MRRTTLEPLYARQSTERTWRGGGGANGGDKRSFVLHCSSNEFEEAQEQAPTQVPNHDKFFDAQTTLWPSDIAVNQRAPGQLQLDDCIYPSPWGSV